jgi:hypothetical protein
MKLEAVEYDWNENIGLEKLEYFRKQGKLHAIGLIAQDVRLYFPEVVYQDESGYYGIDYFKLNAVLVEGIKQQQTSIDNIEDKIQEIEKVVNA